MSLCVLLGRLFSNTGIDTSYIFLNDAG
jgi:hypothetical protein